MPHGSLHRWTLVGALLTLTAATAAQDAAPDPERWEPAIRAFEAWDRKNSPASDAVLFVGSSSIAGWSTARDFPGLPVINRGFGGSHISDVNHFLDRVVLPYRPRAIVLYAGDNDVAAGKSPQRVLRDFQLFTRRVHEELPGTSVMFISIKPSLARWKFWPQMKEANRLIYECCSSSERLVFVDVAASMLGADGKPRPELFVADGLHLNEEGYALWTRMLQPVLERHRRPTSAPVTP